MPHNLALLLLHGALRASLADPLYPEERYNNRSFTGWVKKKGPNRYVKTSKPFNFFKGLKKIGDPTHRYAGCAVALSLPCIGRKPLAGGHFSLWQGGFRPHTAKLICCHRAPPSILASPLQFGCQKDPSGQPRPFPAHRKSRLTFRQDPVRGGFGAEGGSRPPWIPREGWLRRRFRVAGVEAASPAADFLAHLRESTAPRRFDQATKVDFH